MIVPRRDGLAGTRRGFKMGSEAFMRRSLFVVLVIAILGLIAVPATASVPGGLVDRFSQGIWRCGGEEVGVLIVAPGHRVAWIGEDGDQYLATHLDYAYVDVGINESWSYDFGNGPKGDRVACSTTVEDGNGLLTIDAWAVRVPRR
jgi:hypothetical protein